MHYLLGPTEFLLRPYSIVPAWIV